MEGKHGQALVVAVSLRAGAVIDLSVCCFVILN
jgi:hypothetical protein